MDTSASGSMQHTDAPSAEIVPAAMEADSGAGDFMVREE